ncbi:MAG: hypothetical protein WBO37_01525, partial [Gammaproteobacteria bacterium]
YKSLTNVGDRPIQVWQSHTTEQEVVVMKQYMLHRARAQDLMLARVVLGFLMTPLAVMFTIGGAMLAAA